MDEMMAGKAHLLSKKFCQEVFECVHLMFWSVMFLFLIVSCLLLIVWGGQDLSPFGAGTSFPVGAQPHAQFCPHCHPMCQPQDAPVPGCSPCGGGHRGYRLPFLCASHYPPLWSGHKGKTMVGQGNFAVVFRGFVFSKTSPYGLLTIAATCWQSSFCSFTRRPLLNTFTMRQSVCCWKPWMSWRWPSTTRLYGPTVTISSSILYPQSSWTHQRFVKLSSAVRTQQTL